MINVRSVTIRIAEKDKIKLEALSRAIGSRSLGETFSEVMNFVEKRKDEFLASLKRRKGEEPMLRLLREAKGRYGKTDARRVDEYLYGE
ncbi:MAG: hypothetical protein GXO66_10510 [Euryarchaeota archaeon]|nr:hypothetical protein [Euryarchaeota archaeon]